MFGKATQHSFAKKWLLGGMSGKTHDMMWMDMDGSCMLVSCKHGKLPCAINLEGDPVQGVLVMGHVLKEAGSFKIRKINSQAQSLADPPGVCTLIVFCIVPINSLSRSLRTLPPSSSNTPIHMPG